MSQVAVAPSILAADLTRLGDEIRDVEAAGADRIHVDIMDGRFVPNLAGGPDLVRATRRVTQLPLDVHLMVEHPEPHLHAFCEAGADILGVHAETCQHLQSTLSQIRGLGKRASVALNPQTPESALGYVLHDLDQVLIMLVNPGFGGQKLLRSVIRKIRQVRQLLDAEGVRADIAVDGGVTAQVAGELCAAGATVLITGSYVFGVADRKAAVTQLRAAAHAALGKGPR